MRDKGTGSVYQDTRGRWVATLEAGWTKRGTRRRVTRIADNERHARQILAALIREGAAPEGTSAMTVKAYADTWLPRVQQHLRPKSLMVTRAAVGSWIIPTVGHRRLDRLNPGDVRAVSHAILAAGLAPSTASRYRGVLARMLKDARLDGHRVPPVVDDVEGVPQGDGSRDAIPLVDAVRILALAARRPDASRWAAALLEGMRPAEVLGLTWDRVDLEAGTLDVSWQLQPLPCRILRDRTSGFKVPVSYEVRPLVDAYHLTKPKTVAGKRVIPMVSWMVDALRTWKAIAPENPYGLVWTCNGRPIDAKDDREAWRDLVRTALGQEADIPDLYACRHTTVTMLLEAQVPPAVIIAIVGHSTYASTTSYQHIRQEPLREALAAVADRFELPGRTSPSLEN